jgi:hypothetical protein
MNVEVHVELGVEFPNLQPQGLTLEPLGCLPLIALANSVSVSPFCFRFSNSR